MLYYSRRKLDTSFIRSSNCERYYPLESFAFFLSLSFDLFAFIVQHKWRLNQIFSLVTFRNECNEKLCQVWRPCGNWNVVKKTVSCSRWSADRWITTENDEYWKKKRLPSLFVGSCPQLPSFGILKRNKGCNLRLCMQQISPFHPLLKKQIDGAGDTLVIPSFGFALWNYKRVNACSICAYFCT